MVFIRDMDVSAVHSFLILVLTLFLLEARATDTESRPVAVPGEYIIKAQEIDPHSLSSLVGRKLSNAQVSPVLASKGIYKLKVPGRSLMDVQAALRSKAVRIIEPNYLYYPSALPDDPKFAEQWGLRNPGVGSVLDLDPLSRIDAHVENAWKLTIGHPDLVIAVIDTGVDYSHPDLKENIWSNLAELNGEPGVDDDQNGHIDDVRGYDFANSDNDPMDDLEHGTHVAGIIGAQGNNSMGIAGVNWQVKIMPIKSLKPKTGGSAEHNIRAIDYAVRMGAKIINASWGGDAHSKILEEEIRSAGEKGVLFVAAAGNGSRNSDIRPHYPAAYDLPNIISVGAVDALGQYAPFSNYGRRSVHIAAPGVKILSTLLDDSYGERSGTSMAAPFVSGVAGLALAREPDLSLDELRRRILKRGYRLKALKGLVSSQSTVSAYGAVSGHKPLPEPDPEDPEQWPHRPHSIKSPHPYSDNVQLVYEVQVPGAKRFALFFKSFQTEEGFDLLRIYDRQNQLVAVLSGHLDETYSPPIPGDYARLVFTADESNTGIGFEIDGISYQE